MHPTKLISIPLWQKPELVFGGLTLFAVAGVAGGLYWYFSSSVPPSVEFELKKQIYAVGEDVNLKKARLCDENGTSTSNLDKIKFWIEKSGDDDDWKRSNEIKTESLLPSGDNKNDGCVNFSISAKELLKNLPPLKAGDYQMEVIGFDKSGMASKAVSRDFRINAEPTELQFNTNKESYKEKETVVLQETKVCDENGFDDLAKVQFRLKRVGSPWEISDAKPTDTEDKNCASFGYERHNLATGSYQLEGTAYDKHDFKSKPHTVKFMVNAAPRKLRFSMDNSSYKVGSTIYITGTEVCDDDGIRDIKKVEFSIRKDNGSEVDKYAAKYLTSYSKCTSFNHKRKLNLNWGPGSYKLSAIAYDSLDQPSNLATHDFKINDPPRNLSVRSNTPSSTINITGEVCDDDGIRDIDKVEFTPHKDSRNSFRKQDTTVNPEKRNCGSFSYQLNPLSPGSYKLEATAYDTLGEASKKKTHYFDVVNAAPRDLSFVGASSSYRAGSTINMTGKVCDDNGTDDLKKVSFWLKKDSDDNDWQNLPEITSLTPESGDYSCASFTFRYNLPSDLSPGQYILHARAYDRSDENINKQIEFMVLQ